MLYVFGGGCCVFVFVCFWSQFDTISNPEKLLALLFPLVLFINYLKARAKVILMSWINWSPVAGIMSPPKATPLHLSSLLIMGVLCIDLMEILHCDVPGVTFLET